ncbi:hypothetical protein AUP68_16727 [Ilyonectria robusta]
MTPITETDPADRVTTKQKPLPDPLKFSGIWKEYPSWAQQIKNKLLLDAIFFDTE